jgi:hypothetical protein
MRYPTKTSTKGNNNNATFDLRNTPVFSDISDDDLVQTWQSVESSIDVIAYAVSSGGSRYVY